MLANEKNKTTEGRLKLDISILIFFVFYIFMMRGVGSELFVVYLLMILWIYAAFILDITAFLETLKNKAILFLIVFLTYNFVISIFFEGITTSLGNTIRVLYLFIGILMFVYYKNRYSFKELSKLLYVLITIWLYYCIKALIFYSNNPNAAREIVSHNANSYGSIAIGGGYGLAYGSAILGVYILNVIIFNKIKNLGIKIFLTMLLVACFLIGIETGSTITLIAMIIGFVLSFYIRIIEANNFNNMKQLVTKIFVNLFLTAIIIVIFTNIKNIGTWLIKISSTSTELFATRVELIGIKLLYDSSEGTLAAREMLYNRSWNTFLENPLFGISISNGLRMNSLIGGHSELFDNLALYGIVGIIPLLLIFFFSIKKKKGSTKNYNFSYIGTLLVLFVFNTFHYPQANFLLFFILPLMGGVLVGRKRTLKKL